MNIGSIIKRLRKQMKIILIGIILIVMAIVFLRFNVGTYDEYPDNSEVVEKLEQHKRKHGDYPDTLEAIGLKELVDYGPVYFSYNSEGRTFRLCQHYVAIVGAKPTCYDADTRKWNLMNK